MPAVSASASESSGSAGPDEVVFELDDWTPAERTSVQAQLTADQIPHRWEESDLVVREGDADLVDELLDRVEDAAASED